MRVHAALLSLVLLSACTGLGGEPRERYLAAVRDASQAEQSELSDSLTRVSRENSALEFDAQGRLRVVTWKSQESYDSYLAPHDKTSPRAEHAIWVTLAPEVQRFCHAWLSAHPDAGKADLELRLKQRLGLDPAWHYDLFVELWVDPEALFRPCVDPQTDDSGCALRFGDSAPEVSGIADYRAFYHELYYKSFRFGDGVPWTGLGYTYDWGGESEIGASEFILAPSTDYAVARVLPTLDYCRGE